MVLSIEIKKTALISLLLKKSKDQQECSSYCLLSILNCDLKLYAKVLSRTLDSCITSLIHPDQTGFVKGCLASDNIQCRLLHIIEASSNGHPWAVLSLDAEKAFDRVEWTYLWAVLRRFGFGLSFIKMVSILYASPIAPIQTGHPGSIDFVLTRGTRQGCSLSPGLFALPLEPLAQTVRENHAISPITIKGTSHYISLYANDVLLYLSDINSSLPHVLNLFHKFVSFWVSVY